MFINKFTFSYSNSHNMSFIYYLITLLLIYIAGFSWSKVFKINNSGNNFLVSISEKILLGIFIIIIFTSFYSCSYRTINIVLLILILIYSYLKGRTIEYKAINKERKNIWSFTLIIGVFSIVYLYHYLGTVFKGDLMFYAKLSKSIFETGIENSSSLYANFYNDKSIGLYHFSELWLNAFVFKLFNINELESLLYIVYPLLHGLTFITLLGIVYDYFRSIGASLLVTFALLYGIGIIKYQYHFIDSVDRAIWYYGIPYFASSKFLITYPIVFLAFYEFIKNKNYPIFSILISVCILVYISFIVGFIAGVAGLILIYLIDYKFKIFKFPHKSIIWFVLPIISTGLIFVLIKVLNSLNSPDSIIASTSQNWKNYIYPISTYINDFKYFLGTFIRYFTYPFVLYPLTLIGLLIYCYKKAFNKNEALLIIVILIAFIGAAAYNMLFSKLMSETNQALSNILPQIMIFLSLIIITKIKNLKHIYIITAVISIFGIYNLYYAGSFTKYKLSNHQKNLIEIADSSKIDFKWAYYSERYWSRWTYNTNICANPILRSSKAVFPIEIAPLFSDSLDYYCNRAVNINSPICEFYNSTELNNQNIINFLLKNKIDYVYFENTNNVNKDFLNYFIPAETTGNSGLWRVNNYPTQ